MGARGKKRKRKDGSIADGRSQQHGASGVGFPPLQIMETEAAPVTPELLEKSLTIRNRHGVFGPVVPAEMTDDDLFEAELAAQFANCQVAMPLKQRWGSGGSSLRTS